MGDAADALLNGLFCEGCGEVFDDFEEPRYPRRCSSCGGDDFNESEEAMQKPEENEPSILVVGNVVDGIRFVGPFENPDKAIEYGESNDEEWVLARLEVPVVEQVDNEPESQ